MHLISHALPALLFSTVFSRRTSLPQHVSGAAHSAGWPGVIFWILYFSSGYFSRTWFRRSHMVVKTLLYCTRKCGCKGGCMSASCRLQQPRNGSTCQVPVLENQIFSRTVQGTPRTCKRKFLPESSHGPHGTYCDIVTADCDNVTHIVTLWHILWHCDSRLWQSTWKRLSSFKQSLTARPWPMRNQGGKASTSRCFLLWLGSLRAG